MAFSLLGRSLVQSPLRARQSRTGNTWSIITLLPSWTSRHLAMPQLFTLFDPLYSSSLDPYSPSLPPSPALSAEPLSPVRLAFSSTWALKTSSVTLVPATPQLVITWFLLALLRRLHLAPPSLVLLRH